MRSGLAAALIGIWAGGGLMGRVVVVPNNVCTDEFPWSVENLFNNRNTRKDKCFRVRTVQTIVGGK